MKTHRPWRATGNWLLLLFFMTAIGYEAHGQYSYRADYTNAGENPRGLNQDADASTTGWTAIVTGPQSANVWSDTIPIPFSFQFYGSTVTHIRASQNGLVTFSQNRKSSP